MKCVVGQDNLPNWSRLCDDFTQEEIRVNGGHCTSECVDEDVALATKGKKKKGNSSKDLSRLQVLFLQSVGASYFPVS